MKKFIYAVLLIMLIFTTSSCSHPGQPPVTTTPIPRIPVQISPQTPTIVTLPSGSMIRSDIVHVVAPGETVWRLSKMYDVGINDIARVNRLADNKQVEMGQRLKIPNACPVKPVISLYPSKKWKYIIIHHSATDVGGALQFHKGHTKRGWKGLGYNFVIDNGTSGKKDGQIETSLRWLKQQDGAHCKASGMNRKAIGICLVGNFSKEQVSQKQLDSLVYLINQLRKYYKIPLKNIMGHGFVPGARTECPGKKFPWKTLWSRL